MVIGSDRLTSLTDVIPASSFVFLLSPEGVYLRVLSYPCRDRLTVPPEEHEGKRLEEVVPIPLREEARCLFDKAVRERRKIAYSYPHHRSDRWWMCREITPIVDGDLVTSVLMEVYDCSPPARLPAIYVVKP